MKNGKPYKYTSKDRLKKSSGFNSPKTKEKKKNEKSKSVDNTIKIDLDRLNDMDLLDTSFLEGRVDSNVTKPKNTKKNNKDKKKKEIDSNKVLARVHFLRNLFFSLSLVCLFILVCVYSFNIFKNIATNVLEARLAKDDEVVEKEDNSVVDRNYLFVGDYFTDEFIFSKYGHDYHYVKSGDRDLTTQDILNNSKGLIYDYNPSMVFIEVGLFDICDSISEDEIVTNLGRIVNNIKLNRPNAKIYIESIYPINSSFDNYKLKPFEYDLTNEEINKTNKAIKNYCEDNDVNYLDINSILSKKGKLDKTYTDNGFSLNNAGYKQINKYLRKIIGE